MPKSFKIKLKTLYISKKFLSVISFLTGLILGYFLGLFNLHSLDFLPEIPIQFSWLQVSGHLAQAIHKIKINPTFLSDIAAFEAAIMSFLIPLSIEIISKISERYNSDVITRSFEKDWVVKWLPSFLLVNVFAAILLRLISSETLDQNSLTWKMGALIVFVFFIFAAFAIWHVISRIKYFIGNTKDVVNKLYEDAKKSIQ